MAALTVLEEARSTGAQDELDDEQIEELLARATARLQSKNVSKKSKPADRSPKSSFSKLEPGALTKPYVSTKGDVAIFDPTRPEGAERTQKKANGIRVVQDPVAVKRMAEEVSLIRSAEYALL